MKKRLDVILTERGLFESRSKAVMAINANIVSVGGKIIAKPSEKVEEDAEIKIVGETLKYVSRGGLKLEGAIKEFGLNLKGKTVLDMGSSTGGFTDCALQNGAKKVIAVDVGSNQLVDKLRKDSRVECFENTDVKSLSKSVFNKVDLIVADISFVSIVKIMAGIVDKIDTQQIMLLIKPQFECGLEVAKKCKGVIKSEELSLKIAKDTISQLETLGLSLQGFAPSPITGGDGNHEYITLFQRKMPKRICQKTKITTTI